MTRILIADDHRVVAEGIARIVDESLTSQVVALADSIADAVRLAGEYHPDVVLLDVALPDGDGIDAIPRLRVASPEARIAVFTMYAEPAVIQRACEGGADGYLLKSVSASELLEGIQAVAEGSSYLCREARELMEGYTEQTPSLTTREREVLMRLVQGKTIKEIANELFLGFETVHSYTKYLREKLGCPNTAALVRVAIEQHLV